MTYEKPEIVIYNEEDIQAIEAQAASCCPVGKTNS